ncbi:hypothetical protein ACQKML_08120 [Peribacillus frigoritolerans]
MANWKVVFDDESCGVCGSKETKIITYRSTLIAGFACREHYDAECKRLLDPQK